MVTTSTTEPDEVLNPLASEHITGLLERLRREPALRAWVLTAPTGALALYRACGFRVVTTYGYYRLDLDL